MPDADAPTGSTIAVRPLLGSERAALLDLLDGLGPREWSTPTPCPGWTVHDIAVHLAHDDLRRLSAQRDGHTGGYVEADTLDDLAAALDEANEAWVATTAPALSPRLVVEMLSWLAQPSEDHLSGLDPHAMEADVAWAGPGPHPNWLDVAREYTERWVHQQQIRDAVARPGLTDRAYLQPVLDTFAHALPPALPPRPVGTAVTLTVTAPFARSWTAVSTDGGWRLAAASETLAAAVALPAETLWRRAVRMATGEEARHDASAEGDPDLVAAILDLRAAVVADHGRSARRP